MKIDKLLVLFKTHLDIGFTDFASNVITKYMDDYIPKAIDVAAAFRKEGGKECFQWTTGSWLIHEYLRTRPADKTKRLCEAIEAGDITWHGLPFTTHTELMSESLFRYGLSLSKELDKRFGKKTIAAKMTDVPGHTKAMIPHLAENGIEFLHIGVNPASAVPDVPELFRWKSESGKQITVMYHTDYGTFSEIEETGTAIYFAHTNDNQGGQTAAQVRELYASLHEKFPSADIVAANLNNVALAVREVEDELPVITDEIGDSWIHGIGTDPKKIFIFRGLERLSERMPDIPDKKVLQQALIMIPEHTWGLNGQINLADHTNYSRERFEAVRCRDNFRRMEMSWAEQRRYLTDAVAAMKSPYRTAAEEIIRQSERSSLSTENLQRADANKFLTLGKYTLKIDQYGSICHLQKDDHIFCDAEHTLCNLWYEQFTAEQYQRFYQQYNRLDVRWAREDYTKIGMECVNEPYKSFAPDAVTFCSSDAIVIQYLFPREATEHCGCPERGDLLVSVGEDDDLLLDFAWFGKPANRVTEAFWIGFHPIATNKRIQKLGRKIDPKQVVRKGNRRLHGTDYGILYDEMAIETLDTSLVSPGQPSLLNFRQDIPTDGEGVFFNLYNNVWATNFPMWYDENARFRFVLHFFGE